jgi:N-acetylgalactosamine kinase
MTVMEQDACALADRFLDVFGRRPTVFARAPGRVNLLGEHTDYNNLPVLPMAIDRAIRVAGVRGEDRCVRLANASEVFRRREYELSASIAPFPSGDWGNYHKAAAQDLASLFGTRELCGGDFLVDGNIPPGAGLSSSAALVVASALALLAVNERIIPPIELAERMAVAERYVGTMSGGMDQAASLLGEAGCALRVDFDPLRVRKIPAAGEYAVVVCDSLVRAEKSGPARAAYNRRVAECRLACRVLEHALAADLSRPLRSFGDLMQLFPGRPLSEFTRVLEDALPPGPLVLEEIAHIIDCAPEQLAVEAGVSEVGVDTFPLLQRARHVLTEADRVCRAEAALASQDWITFGALMDASHASCRDDYEVSCGELEELVSVAKNGGAIGARLTGAGFGGCTVNLVPIANVSSFQDFIEREYYHHRMPVQTGEHCFVFTPSAGASVVRL